MSQVSIIRRLALLAILLLCSVGLLTWLIPRDGDHLTHIVAAQEGPTPTDTPVPPAPTNTSAPPTPTSTATHTPVPPTATNTATPLPTSTSTHTSTPTNTPTHTPVPPTATNQPPSISSIPDRVINEDGSTGFISFTVSDLETNAALLVVTAASSDATLVPASNIVLGGSGSSRTIKIRPAPNKHGSTTIGLSVTDGSARSSTSFILTVRSINDAPFVDLNGSGPGIDFVGSFITTLGPARIASTDLRLNDVDDSTLASAKVTLVNPHDALAESLAAVTAGTNIAASYASGTLDLTGQDTISHYRQVLRSITYQNEALSPNPDPRIVEVLVRDGKATSETAVSTINIVDPRLIIQKSPQSQSVPLGGTANFAIRVENSGNVALRNVQVEDPLSSDCARNLSQLEVGQVAEYTCSDDEFDGDFTNVATAFGEDASGNEATDSASARVEVENPNIQIVKSPSSQTRLYGETANFDVYVINTSSTIDLTNVEVQDPLAPDCSRTGAHSFQDLAAGQDVLYQCRMENIAFAFTNSITVTAENNLTGQPVQDSSTAAVELLDLSASLSAEPNSVPAEGGAILFSLTVANSGSVPFKLSSLTSEALGPLHEPGNSNLLNNDCVLQTLPNLGIGERFSCAFTGVVSSTSPQKEFSVIVEAVDIEGTVVSKRAITNVSLNRPFPFLAFIPLHLLAYAQPDEENDLPCQAYPLAVRRTYSFAADDTDDWYYFDIAQAGEVTVRLRDFIPADGQLAVWYGPDCANLDTLMGHNGNFQASKEITFRASVGRYYIWIINSDGRSYATPYSLFVDIR